MQKILFISLLTPLVDQEVYISSLAPRLDDTVRVPPPRNVTRINAQHHGEVAGQTSYLKTGEMTWLNVHRPFPVRILLIESFEIRINGGPAKALHVIVRVGTRAKKLSRLTEPGTAVGLVAGAFCCDHREANMAPASVLEDMSRKVAYI